MPKFSSEEIELLKVEDISRILGIHPATIRQYIRSGKLKARKIGRSYYISKERFKEFIGAVD